ncbi:hypothetical protein GCM10007301_49150 [Azorhizobium oxalatiphilum]|uniref:DUF465 domain-containing protein n=1 Tax=Azorhizobium oxalatiphilum TaxID=980631 RepID=A0A917CC04_9HYPH|nr:YdcH family protein [Azorhizobium oxalatiphilum]GGF83228.1 hypothetical protein GCM10007301_49150 [Azorhizobium oxalatiphilum]
MSDTPHEILAEFPEHAQQIHELRTVDAHFARLYDAYHEVNRAVHRAETNIEPRSDEGTEALRKERIRLKDEIYALLTR